MKALAQISAQLEDGPATLRELRAKLGYGPTAIQTELRYLHRAGVASYQNRATGHRGAPERVWSLVKECQ